jgi:hypothetical protein
VGDVVVGFWSFYFLMGVVVLLGDIAWVCAMKHTTLRDQMKASLFLAGDDLIGLTMSMLLIIAAWPVMLVMLAGGPPTPGD